MSLLYECVLWVTAHVHSAATFDLLLLQWSCSASNNKTLWLYRAAPRCVCDCMNAKQLSAGKKKKKKDACSAVESLGKQTVGTAAVVCVFY